MKFTHISRWIVCLMVVIVSSIAIPPQTMAYTARMAQEAHPASTSTAQQPGLHPLLVGTFPESGTINVIVHLSDVPLSRYRGGIAGLRPVQLEGKGRLRIDPAAKANAAYLSYLDRQQAKTVATIRQLVPQTQQLASYRILVNAVALSLPAEQVKMLQNVAGITMIEAERIDKLQTDSSNAFLGTPAFWDVLGDDTGATAGENLVVGVLDTGIYNPSSAMTTTGIHQSLLDPSPVGGDYPNTFSYKGVCAAAGAQAHDGTFGMCNDKLIGAWWYNLNNSAFEDEAHSPFDEDGHGTHTATTIAGNGGISGPYGGSLSGVAPRARIIAYKVCWVKSGGCSTLNSTAALEQAALDDVDVVNFSIGGGASPWTDTVALGFLALTDLGVIVNAAAGNNGPTASTVNHRAPWIMTVAASTQSRTFRGMLSNVSGPGSPPGPFVGASSPFQLAAAGTIKLAPPQNASDQTPSLCQQPYAPGTFQATDIVICRRGINNRIDKYNNVFAGGAGGAILVNANNNQGIIPDICTKVCVHLEKNDSPLGPGGETLINYVLAHPNQVTANLAGGVSRQERGDVMADFSSRGPSASLPDVLKPDITAIGVDVVAGTTPYPYHGLGEPEGLIYRSLNGTSMATPHMAGASVLMRQLHPDWSSAEIRSALMTTAVTSTMLDSNGVTPASPFAMGSGRVNLSIASAAGLVFPETYDNYLNANPVIGGDPRTLNLANFTDSRCVVTCSWTRTVRNTLDTQVTWTAAFEGGNQMQLTIEPATLNIPANGTATFTVTANMNGTTLNAYSFDRLVLTETSGQAPRAVLPVVVRSVPSTLPTTVIIETDGAAGTHTIPDVKAIAITDMTSRRWGLTQATLTTQFVGQDSVPGEVFDDISDGVFTKNIGIGSGNTRFVAEIVNTTAHDIDLFLCRDLNNDGIPQENELIASSATANTLEYINIANPPAGTYIVVVQNWEASTNGTDGVTLATAAVPASDAANMTITAPGAVNANTPFDIDIGWDLGEPTANSRWYGTFDLGSDAASQGNLGKTFVDIRHGGGATTVMLPFIRR